jgi:hypothetical protein
MSRTGRQTDDASKQLCTEIVYGVLDGKGPVDFVLVQRPGHETLSATDIANNCLHISGASFESIIFAEEATDSSQHLAEIVVAGHGNRHV